MKTSVISDEFRARYLSNPDDPEAFEGRAVVFDGPEDYHARIDDPALGIDDALHPGHARHRADRLSGRAPRWSTCSRPRADPSRASPSCPASATAASRAPPARPRSSTPAPRRRPAAGWRCCAPATGSGSTCARRPADVLLDDEELGPPARGAGGRRRLSDIRRTRRPGRRSSAAWSTSSTDGMVLRPALAYQRVAESMPVPRDNH